MGFCHQVTFLFPHCITSRLVPLLRVIDAPIQVPNILDLTVSFKFLNFSSQLCLLFVPELSANFTSYIVQNIYIVLAWILYPLHFSPLPLIHSSSNQGLFCFNSCRPRLSFTEVWIFSLMFSQVLFTSFSSFKFYKAQTCLLSQSDTVP